MFRYYNKIMPLCFYIIIFFHISSSFSEDFSGHITSPEKAYEIAKAYIGNEYVVDVLDKTSLAELITVTDNQTPFLHDSINNKQCWKVSLTADMKLDNWKLPNEETPTIHDFVVLIDQKTGRLISIRSVLEKDYEFKYDNTPVDSVEMMLKGMKEIYYDIPYDIPACCFIDALDDVDSSPYEAKEIYGTYLICFLHNTDPMPVWNIELKDIPTPIFTHGPLDPEMEFKFKVRSIVDANSGVFMRSELRGYKIKVLKSCEDNETDL